MDWAAGFLMCNRIYPVDSMNRTCLKSDDHYDNYFHNNNDIENFCQSQQRRCQGQVEQRLQYHQRRQHRNHDVYNDCIDEDND